MNNPTNGRLRVLSVKIKNAERVETAAAPHQTKVSMKTHSASTTQSASSYSGYMNHTNDDSTGGQAPVNMKSSNRSSYTVYLVDVKCQLGGETFTVSTFRRYSEFREFDKKITALFPGRKPFPFPPKRIFGNLKPDFVQMREQQLQHYLDGIIQQPNIAGHQLVLNFLCPIVEKRLMSNRPVSAMLQDSIEFMLNSSIRSKRISLSLDSTPPIPTLDQLPENLLVNIMRHLNFRDLLSLSRVSRRLYVVASQNSLWMPLLMRFYPQWPLYIANPPTCDVDSSAKKQFLRMFWETTPHRKSFKQKSQFLRCKCNLLKMLGTITGPGAGALFDTFSAVGADQKEKAKASSSTPGTDGADDENERMEYFRETSTTCVHTDLQKASICCHFHANLDERRKVVSSYNNNMKFTYFFLIRSNFIIAVFFRDNLESLNQIPEQIKRARIICPAMPVFLVGVPSFKLDRNIPKGVSLEDSDTRDFIRVKAMETGISIGAVKYIELNRLNAQSINILLAEIASVMMKELAESPAVHDELPAVFDSKHRSLIELEEDEAFDSMVAPSNSVLPYVTTTTTTTSTNDALGSDASQQDKRVAQAVLRGAREHFIVQLERFSLDGVIHQYENANIDLDDPKNKMVQNLPVIISNTIKYVHTSSLWCNAPMRERVLVSHEIEEYVFEKLYKILFSSPKDKEMDRQTEQKISKLAFVLPSHLDIPKQFWDSDAWTAAANELLDLNYYVSPFGKMHCLMNCVKIIQHSLLVHSSGKGSGADNFMPHLVYVLIKANPPFLASNIAFVKRFSVDAEVYTQESYYWTTLDVAVKFLQNISSKQLSISDAEFKRLTSDELVPMRLSKEEMSAVPTKAKENLGEAAKVDGPRRVPTSPQPFTQEGSVIMFQADDMIKTHSDLQTEAAVDSFVRQRARTRRIAAESFSGSNRRSIVINATTTTTTTSPGVRPSSPTSRSKGRRATTHFDLSTE